MMRSLFELFSHTCISDEDWIIKPSIILVIAAHGHAYPSDSQDQEPRSLEK